MKVLVYGKSGTGKSIWALTMGIEEIPYKEGVELRDYPAFVYSSRDLEDPERFDVVFKFEDDGKMVLEKGFNPIETQKDD